MLSGKGIECILNILVVSQYFWPENFRINELVSEWTRRGHRVTILTGQPNYPGGKVFADYLSNRSSYDSYAGATVIRVPMFARGTGRFRLLLNYLSFVLGACIWGSWRLRGVEVDVIFTFEPSPILVGIPSALFRWIKRAPQAFWVLDLWPETLRAVGIIQSKSILAIIERLVRIVYRNCDLILAQSQGFVSKISRLSLEGTRIEYFPAWAEVFPSSDSVTPAPEVPMSIGVFTILFAGNIGEAQDFPAILDAASALKDRNDIRWVIVGDGRMAGWLREQILLRKLDQQILIVGRYPLERMPSFFAHADALLVSLKDDPIFALTIPGKLQSYFSTGIPVLAMLNGEGAAIIENAKAGLVSKAGDGKGLAKIVRQLIEMEASERSAIGARGVRLCAEEFDREELIKRLDNWLVEIVTHHSK